MDRNIVDGTVADAAAKDAWTAPQVVETDIAAITANASGSNPDGGGLGTTAS